MNIGNPDEFTILELANRIKHLTQSKSEIIYCPSPKDDPKQRKPDISEAQNKLNGWKPLVNLDQGLIKTIKYFESII